MELTRDEILEVLPLLRYLHCHFAVAVMDERNASDDLPKKMETVRRWCDRLEREFAPSQGGDG